MVSKEMALILPPSLRAQSLFYSSLPSILGMFILAHSFT